jgi:phosphoglycolate phosphatase-like HAD superfamily hydrolase
MPEITTATYRALLRTPIRSFYAAVLDRDPSDDKCDLLKHAFHAYYLLYEKEAALSSGLPHLFRQWHCAGHTQSLLSLSPHDKLVPAVEQHGLTRYFALVQGKIQPYPERKAAHLTDHLTRLKVNPAAAVLIGDLADDADAAEQAGARRGPAHRHRRPPPAAGRAGQAKSHPAAAFPPRTSS